MTGATAPATVIGRLEGFQGRRVRGWAFMPSQPERRLGIRLVVDGTEVATARADLQRSGLARAGIGDGGHGFRFDLAPMLSQDQGARVLRAIVLETGTDLPGSPLEATISADGRAERFERGDLVGWAHGPAFAPAMVEILREGRILLTWPADLPRGDLLRNSIGTGRHGFRLPFRLLLGDAQPGALRLRIAGTRIELPLPPPAAAAPADWLDALPASLPGTPHASATAARRAVLQGLAEGRADPARSGRIAPELLGQALNRLRQLETLLAEREERRRILAGRQERREVSPMPLPLPLPPGGNGPCAALHALLHAPSGEEITPETVARTLLPAYRAAGPEDRAAFHAALRGHAGPVLLGAVARAFRAADFLEVPPLAQGCQLELADTPIPLGTIRHQRLIRSWHEMARAAPALPAPAVLVAPRGGRAIYALWRSVPYDTNGYATRSHYLLRALRDLGEDVIGVTRLGYPWDAKRKQSPAALIEEIDGVPYWHLGGPAANRATLPLDAYVEECAERIAAIAVATGAGVIHAASNWLSALPALRAARLTGLPFCYEMRGLWEVTRASNQPGYERTDHFELFRRMETLVAGSADLLFTITRQVRDEMAARGVDVSGARLAPNGVEVARFEPLPPDPALRAELGIEPGETVFGYIGTFAEYEGLPELCRAAAALHGRGERFRLLLVGDGPAGEEVKAAISALDHGGRIILRGRVPFTDVPRYYGLVDVAVFPRRPVEIAEMVSPLKPFEAMAMHRPVIVSDVRAMADIVRHGETGWLFRKGDLADLTERMAQLIHNPAAIRAAGLAARRFVEEHHDWRSIARRIATGWGELRRL